MDNIQKPIKLPIVEKPYEGESTRGYLIRLAEMNNYATPLWIKKAFPKLSEKHYTRDFIDELANIAGLSVAEHSKLLGSVWSSKLPLIHLAARERFCPQCVKENGFLDGIWELNFVTACPYHGTYLVEKCGECGKLLSWTRKSIRHCTCGADLTEIQSIVADADVIYLTGKLFSAAGRSVVVSNVSGFPDYHLSRLPLLDLNTLIRFMSCHIPLSSRSGRKLSKKLTDVVVDLANASLILKDWPNGLNSLLESHRLHDGTFMGEGLQQGFGRFYKDLYSNANKKALEFVIPQFQDFVSKNWVGIIDNRYKRLGFGRVNEFITGKQAAKSLGITEAHLRKLANEELLDTNSHLRPSGRYHTILQRSEIDKFTKLFSHVVNKNQVMKMMHISEKQFDALVSRDILHPLVKHGDEGMCEWWFDSRIIMKYLDKIHSVTPDRKPDVNVISLYDAAKYHLFSRELFADLLVNIERGHVKVVGHDISEKKFNLSSILLSKKSFNSFLEKVIKKANGYSIPETAHIMSLKEEVLYHLVNHGFISCSKDPTHLRRGRIITHDAIVKFQATYISLTELTGIPIKSVERLKSIGAFPAIGGGVDGCRQVFYKREDISILWSLP